MTRIFIDGSAGTTGLRIYERLSERKDIELIILPDDKRKDEASIKEALHEADIAFLIPMPALHKVHLQTII